MVRRASQVDQEAPARMPSTALVPDEMAAPAMAVAMTLELTVASHLAPIDVARSECFELV